MAGGWKQNPLEGKAAPSNTTCHCTHYLVLQKDIKICWPILAECIKTDNEDISAIKKYAENY